MPGRYARVADPAAGAVSKSHLLLKQLVGAYHVVRLRRGRGIVLRVVPLLCRCSCCAWALGRQPATAHEGARTYRVVYVDPDDVLNIRSGPSVGYRIVGRIPPGGRGVRLVGHCQGWCPVSYNGASGWVNPRLSRVPRPAVERRRSREDGAPRARGYVAVEPPAQRRRARLPSHWQVTGVAEGESLKVHDAPSSSASVVHAFEPQTGCIKLAGGCQKPWCQVKFPGLSGDRSRLGRLQAPRPLGLRLQQLVRASCVGSSERRPDARAHCCIGVGSSLTLDPTASAGDPHSAFVHGAGRSSTPRSIARPSCYSASRTSRPGARPVTRRRTMLIASRRGLLILALVACWRLLPRRRRAERLLRELQGRLRSLLQDDPGSRRSARPSCSAASKAASSSKR